MAMCVSLIKEKKILLSIKKGKTSKSWYIVDLSRLQNKKKKNVYSEHDVQ